MASLSKSMYIGRLTRDPELKQVKINGADVAVVNFTIAVDEEVGQGTDFYNIVAWRGLAETVGKFMTKGRLVYVEGRSKTRKYAITKEGVEFDNYVTETHATRVEFLDRAPQGQETLEAQDTPIAVTVGTEPTPW